MPPARNESVRQAVQRALARGDIVAASPVTEARGIGPYLAGRLRRALGAAEPLTVGEYWARTARLTPAQATRVLHRALQNARGNQCVPRTRPSPIAVEAADEEAAQFHAGDVNQHGYEAAVALLDAGGGRAARALPARLPRRTATSSCGCRLVCDGPCVRGEGGACVPRSPRARGFVGVAPRPDQGVRAATAAERTRVRRAGSRARSPGTDPDALADVAAGLPRGVRYAQRGARMWRSPGAVARLPVVRR